MNRSGSETNSSSLIRKRKKTRGETNALGNQVVFFDILMKSLTISLQNLLLRQSNCNVLEALNNFVY